MPAALLQPATAAACDGNHGKVLALLHGAGASLPDQAALSKALGRAAAGQQEEDVVVLLALQASPVAVLGGERRAEWKVGDRVVLRPGLAEKGGLKAGEIAAVSDIYSGGSYSDGPGNDDGEYEAKRVSDGKELKRFKADDFVSPTTPLRVAAGTGSVPIVSALLAKLKACGG